MNVRNPPRLLIKTMVAVSTVTVVLLLLVVFVVTLSVRQQVRQTVNEDLESRQQQFSALETRHQREMRSQAATLAESPTLKAALDTYVAFVSSSDESTKVQLFTTITNELQKLTARVDADAVVLVDSHQNTLAAAGRVANRWPLGRPVSVIPATGDAANYDGVVHIGNYVFRVASTPLQLTNDTLIGTLYFGTSLDSAYTDTLAQLSGTKIAIVSDGMLLASTLSSAQGREFQSHIAKSRTDSGTVELDGEAYAFRRLVPIGDTSFWELGSIDEASRAALRQATYSLLLIAAGAIALALIGSFWLSHQVTGPIGQLSASLEKLAAAHDLQRRLPLTGSSRELDTLTETFNALISSVATAEAQTEAAYTGAIRALAAALDARDPYTAGHSERVSVLAVAIGRVLALPVEELEVIRLGALLHDIGKIGIPDDVLRKPTGLTPSEYDQIKQHPVLGARILKSVPFLAPHIPIVELHHERPDGRGYPHGLRDEDIPLPARIVHVADAYDAMTSARAYRRARPAGEALRELWRCSGTEFHAEIVGALASALPGVTTDVREPAFEGIGG